MAMDPNNNTDVVKGSVDVEVIKTKTVLPSARAKDILVMLLEERKADIAIINKSQYSSYRDPVQWYQKFMNILCSSNKKRLKDFQASAKGAKGCEIMEKYRYFVSKDLPIPEIEYEINKAVQNSSQLKITSFFSKQSRPNRPIEKETLTLDAENKETEQDNTLDGAGEHSDLPENHRSLFTLFEV